jgi:predicted oxidoreductase
MHSEMRVKMAPGGPEVSRLAARSLSMQLEPQDWFEVWTAASGAEVP